MGESGLILNWTFSRRFYYGVHMLIESTRPSAALLLKPRLLLPSCRGFIPNFSPFWASSCPCHSFVFFFSLFLRKKRENHQLSFYNSINSRPKIGIHTRLTGAGARRFITVLHRQIPVVWGRVLFLG
ncbi:hypothetical protein BDW59DRAFT_19379 [Aspergillus cavernicola]|uniref:Uncharacterized protein n=1 Tax=Aspergillus cavernicola TaxID=176166 RepID=A0ABR4HH80_9EURO